MGGELLHGHSYAALLLLLQAGSQGGHTDDATTLPVLMVGVMVEKIHPDIFALVSGYTMAKVHGGNGLQGGSRGFVVCCCQACTRSHTKLQPHGSDHQ